MTKGGLKSSMTTTCTWPTPRMIPTISMRCSPMPGALKGQAKMREIDEEEPCSQKEDQDFPYPKVAPFLLGLSESLLEPPPYSSTCESCVRQKANPPHIESSSDEEEPVDMKPAISRTTSEAPD